MLIEAIFSKAAEDMRIAIQNRDDFLYQEVDRFYLSPHCRFLIESIGGDYDHFLTVRKSISLGSSPPKFAGKDLKDEMARLKNRGLSFTQISQLVGIDRSRCYELAKEYGLIPPGDQRKREFRKAALVREVTNVHPSRT